ncbi:MAG TPA: hypothetical protein VK923_15340 [Euzebyales bacterium]|nr:hypothetical protein [Euzebyales bacterium]
MSGQSQAARVVSARRGTAHVARRALLVGALLLVTACAPGPNPEIGTAAQDGVVAGFWLGLWHGVIAPITFVVSLFTDEVTIYEVHNSGNWYDAGFFLGFGVLLGGGASGSRATWR